MLWINLVSIAVFLWTFASLSSGQRDNCPLENDFPPSLSVKGRTVQCSPTPEEYDCDWHDTRHYACHNLRVEDSHRVSRSENITLDSAYADLCLDMLEVAGEGLGRTATGRVNSSIPGSIHYSTDGMWTVLSEVGLPNSKESYSRVACQTSGVVRDVEMGGHHFP